MSSDYKKLVTDFNMKQHPLFGEPKIAEGNKRLYIVNLSLDLIPHMHLIYENMHRTELRNRKIDPAHVDQIYKHQLEYRDKYNCYDPHGTITIGLDGKTPMIFIIDGQHRFFAFKRFLEEGSISIPNIVIEFYKFNNPKELVDRFNTINLAVPVPLSIITPDEIVDGAIEMLEEHCPDSFSDNASCNRPSIHVDTLKDSLIKNSIVKELNITTSSDLFKHLINLDELLGKNEEQVLRLCTNTDERGRIQRAYVKCRQNNRLFLGVFSRPYSKVVEYLIHDKIQSGMMKKLKIPKCKKVNLSSDEPAESLLVDL